MYTALIDWDLWRIDIDEQNRYPITDLKIEAEA